MPVTIGNPMIRMPSHATKGEIIEVRSLIMNPMTTGLQKNKAGKIIPAHFIQTVAAVFNGKQLTAIDWSTAISANPFLAYKMRAESSGMLEMTWKDNQGGSWIATAKLTVA